MKEYIFNHIQVHVESLEGPGNPYILGDTTRLYFIGYLIHLKRVKDEAHVVATGAGLCFSSIGEGWARWEILASAKLASQSAQHALM